VATDIPHRGLMRWVHSSEEVLVAPDHPFLRAGILPRPALIEMLAQGAAWEMGGRAAERRQAIVHGRLVAIRAMRFMGDVRAGDVLQMQFAPGPAFSQLAQVHAIASVAGAVVAEGDMTFHVVTKTLV